LARDQIRISRISPVVESPAMLPDDAPADWNRPFLNLVAECDAQGSPEELLARLKQIELEWSRIPGRHILLWMGIVNVTPDSFSDGGKLASWPAIDAHVDALVAAGASFIDVGAESTRPGATPLDAEQEWERLQGVLGPLIDKHASARLRPRFSLDTYHASTARRALALGIDVINDVGGLTSPEMLELAAT